MSLTRLTRTLQTWCRRVDSSFLFGRRLQPSTLYSPTAFQHSAAFSTSAPHLDPRLNHKEEMVARSGNEKTEAGSDSVKVFVQDLAKRLLDVKGNPSIATESSSFDMFSFIGPTVAAVEKPKRPFKDGQDTERKVLCYGTRRGVGQKDRSPTKISIAMKSFDCPFLENWELPPHTKQIGLPDSRVLYTVLRSPHIDKKSREQFEMKIKKMVVQTETQDLRKKLFWLKRQRIFGAQYEIVFSCKTRLDNEKLQSLI